MAKSINQAGVRENLAPRREPYWHPLGKGRSIGFRKMSKATEGAWLARWWHEDEERYYHQSLGDLAQTQNKDRYYEAVRKAEAWFREKDQGGEGGEDSVAAVCVVYASKLRRETSEEAAKDAELRFERLVNHDPIGKIEIAKLKPTHALAWRERLIARGNSRRTVNRDMVPLRAALNLAYESRKVSSDFAWSQALAPLEVDDEEGRRTLYLDGSQRHRLVEHASEEFRPLVAAWNLLPMRPGEIPKCRVRHLDVKRRVLTIPKGKTKSREVPLTDEAFVHFRECAGGKTPAAWLISRADGRQWTRNMWRFEIADAVARAKLPQATIAYTMRHSTITDLLVGGVDIFTVAKLSGTSVAMIDKFYGKLLNEHARKALSILSLK